MQNKVTPVGRLVQGDLYKGEMTDMDGKPYVDKATGQPQPRYFFAIAIPKGAPATANSASTDEILQAIHAEGAIGFPAMFPNGQCINPQFHFKYENGDSQIPNSKNSRPCDKEGFPGCFVIKCNTTIPLKVVEFANGAYAGKEGVKKGSFIRVSLSIKPNGSQQSPGVFINPDAIQFVGYGEEIQSGPDAATMFGAQGAVALPAGASATPLAATAAMPTPPVTAQAAVQAAIIPPVTGAAPAAPVAPVAPVAPAAPAHDFVDGPNAKFTHAGAVYTRAQLQTSGWTDIQINALPKAVG